MEPRAPRPGNGRNTVLPSALSGFVAGCLLAAGAALGIGVLAPPAPEPGPAAPTEWADLDCDGEQDPALLVLDRNGPALAGAAEVRAHLPSSWAEDEDDSVGPAAGGSEHVKRSRGRLSPPRARGPKRRRATVSRFGADGSGAGRVSFQELSSRDRVFVPPTREPGDPRGPPALAPLSGNLAAGASPVSGSRDRGAAR